MKSNELKKGDKVWLRGVIDEGGDFNFKDGEGHIILPLIDNNDQDIKKDGHEYDMSQAKELLKPEITQFLACWIEEHKESYSRWDD